MKSFAEQRYYMDQELHKYIVINKQKEIPAFYKIFD